METAYDWITLTIFAGLVVLFLQRSMADDNEDSIWHYLGCAVGCAVANYLGNEGQDILAVALILVTISYIVLVLKPIDLRRFR